MGVYIKGIDKPECCNTCPFSGFDERESLLYCRIDNEDIEMFLRNDCPIQPIDDEKVEKTQRDLINAWKVFLNVIKEEKP